MLRRIYTPADLPSEVRALGGRAIRVLKTPCPYCFSRGFQLSDGRGRRMPVPLKTAGGIVFCTVHEETGVTTNLVHALA